MKPGSATLRGSFASNRASTTTALAGRASATAPPGTQPQSAATSDAWSHFLRPSLSAASLADRREIVGVIEHAIREGGTHLDFHNASAAALQAVPGAAIKALARQATAVTLPAGLDGLPRCLNRLKALRSIEMAEYTARQIDVTRWDLDTLTVTGRTELRWIAANEDTRVSCPAPGIRRKVCVNVYRDGKLLGHTAAGSRRYIKVLDGRALSINGVYTMRNGERAVCRHIAAWWLGARATRREDKRSGTFDAANNIYAPLGNRDSFLNAVTEDTVGKWTDALYSATRNIMVGNDRFGEVVEREFRQMRKGDIPATRQFYVKSARHAMALELGVKHGLNGKPEYSIVFYDPNVSKTHVRILCHQAREARAFGLTDLLPEPEMSALYFGEHAPVVTLFDVDSIQAGKKRSVRTMLSEREKRSPMALHVAIGARFEGEALALIDELRAMPADAVDWSAFLLPKADEVYYPPVVMAIDEDLSHLAGKVINLAITLRNEGVVKPTFVLDLLHQEYSETGPAYTALQVACARNDSEFIQILTDALLRPEADGLASAAEYEDLLGNGGPSLPSPYALALQDGQHGAAIAMIDSVLQLTAAKRITPDQCVRLAACHDSHGVPAIQKAFEEGNAQLVHSIMHRLISIGTANFSSPQLRAMLAATYADGTPALRATYGTGHAELLSTYGKLVLFAVSRERIKPADAIALLLASRPDETPCEALQAIAPQGEMLRTLDDLLHEVRLARWLPADLSEALDALNTEDSADPLL